MNEGASCAVIEDGGRRPHLPRSSDTVGRISTLILSMPLICRMDRSDTSLADAFTALDRDSELASQCLVSDDIPYSKE
jgi:hypothetical protein